MLLLLLAAPLAAPRAPLDASLLRQLDADVHALERGVPATPAATDPAKMVGMQKEQAEKSLSLAQGMLQQHADHMKQARANAHDAMEKTVKLAQENYAKRAEMATSGMQGMKDAVKAHVAKAHEMREHMLKAANDAATMRTEMATKAASSMLAAMHRPYIARLGVMQEQIKEAEAQHAEDAKNPQTDLLITDVSLG